MALEYWIIWVESQPPNRPDHPEKDRPDQSFSEAGRGGRIMADRDREKLMLQLSIRRKSLVNLKTEQLKVDNCSKN